MIRGCDAAWDGDGSRCDVENACPLSKRYYIYIQFNRHQVIALVCTHQTTCSTLSLAESAVKPEKLDVNVDEDEPN